LLSCGPLSDFGPDVGEGVSVGSGDGLAVGAVECGLVPVVAA